MTQNLSELILRQRDQRPQLILGTPDNKVSLELAVDRAASAAELLGQLGFAVGDRIAVVAPTSTEYLVFWLACQLAGLSPALTNPSYPDDLLQNMISDLNPKGIASPAGDITYGSDAIGVGFAQLLDGRLLVSAKQMLLKGTDAQRLPGPTVTSLKCAGFMHTSGTTGRPKFCAQSHLYFLRLARFVADFMGLEPADNVLAPLPMFHINPLGYGFVGSIHAGANVTALARFKPEEFWPLVKAEASTALFLHAPPVQVLKQRTSAADAVGHAVRIMFYADYEFIEKFRIHAAVSGYGSTEVGGLTHLRKWNRGETERPAAREGIGHIAGTARSDVEWRLSTDGEIAIRGIEPGVLFSGYWHDGKLDPSLDADGWFATGDIGRQDGQELIFLQRRSESIRVRGEYVPIDYVEQLIASAVPSMDIALWKREEGRPTNESPVLYVSGDRIRESDIKAAISKLPKFMRPVEVIRVATIPRDEGAGKVRRRLLKDAEVLESYLL